MHTTQSNSIPKCIRVYHDELNFEDHSESEPDSEVLPSNEVGIFGFNDYESDCLTEFSLNGGLILKVLPVWRIKLVLPSHDLCK